MDQKPPKCLKTCPKALESYVPLTKQVTHSDGGFPVRARAGPIPGDHKQV